MNLILITTYALTVAHCAATAPPRHTCEQRRRHKLLQPDPSLEPDPDRMGQIDGRPIHLSRFLPFCLLYAALRQRCKMDEEASEEREGEGGAWVADLVGATEFHEFDQFGGRAY